MRHKGVPKIETLPATKHSPQRYRVRWDRGSKSYTDTDMREVMRFAADLVANDYNDPRSLGNVYGKHTKFNEEVVSNVHEGRTFKSVAEAYLNTLNTTPGYLRRCRRCHSLHRRRRIRRPRHSDPQPWNT